MSTYSTYDGGTVEAIRIGPSFEMVYRTASGRTAATVRMCAGDAMDLIDQLVNLTGIESAVYERGYKDGQADSR